MGGTGNRAYGNTAKNNGEQDVRDGNGNCTTNRWEANIFGSRDPACIT
jgi:hypothetical protein